MSIMTIALTMGDPAGIGPEVVLKLLKERDQFSEVAFVVCGSPGVFKETAAALGLPMSWPEKGPRDIALLMPGEVMVLEPPGMPAGPFETGKVSGEAGCAAMLSVRLAADLAKTGAVDAMVTAPINKEAVGLAGFPTPGHTEFLAVRTGAEKVVMMLCSEKLRVSLVSTHVALRRAVEGLTQEGIVDCIRITEEGLRRWFGVRNPRIAVAGLNPHAGETGRFGEEEGEIIEPAVRRAREMRIDCKGPVSPDTVFLKATGGEFDAVVCMYHDQGLIPLKLLSFGKAVNVTLGLPIVRTSVDHGTAFDIAGKGEASASSMAEAVRLAMEIVRNRRSHD